MGSVSDRKKMKAKPLNRSVKCEQCECREESA